MGDQFPPDLAVDVGVGLLKFLDDVDMTVGIGNTEDTGTAAAAAAADAEGTGGIEDSVAAVEDIDTEDNFYL